MRKITLVLSLILSMSAVAQQALKNKLDNYLRGYRPSFQHVRSAAHLSDLVINDSLRTIDIIADNHLGEQLMTPQVVDEIYNDLRALLPDSTRDYQLSVKTGGYDLYQLIPNRLRSKEDVSRTWGNIEYKGKPWVSNASLPYEITSGLYNRHLTVWASHGRYFHIKDYEWKWQRPPLFGTREDLFTQTIVIPYLIPMLENAGAVVFTPRERDWQRNEVIVDNDTPRTSLGIYQAV